MEIKLKSLELENFKGVRSFKADFGQMTSIKGRNAMGKTSIFDGYMWLLFDKDSHNNKKFNIKTLDKNGQAIPMIDHRVKGSFEINGKAVTMEKVYKENWTKKNGATDKEFKGHTTDYYWNDVPVKKSDYEANIKAIIDEDIFKLLSNPKYFSVELTKEERRKILIDILGQVDPERLYEVNPDFRELDLENFSLEDTEAKHKAIKKNANKDLEEIPARIDELNKTIKPTLLSHKDLEDKVKMFKSSIASLNDKIREGDNTEALKEIFQKINVLQEEKFGLENAYKEENRKLEENYQDRLKERDRLFIDLETMGINIQERKEALEKKRPELEKEIEDLRKKYEYKAGESWNEDTTCPTCGQDLPIERIEDAKKAFNKNKAEELEKIAEAGKEKAAEIAHLDEELKDLYGVMAKNKKDLEELVKVKIDQAEKIEKPQRIGEIEKELKALEEKRTNLGGQGNKELEERRNKLTEELEEVQRDLTHLEAEEETKARIEELKKRMKDLAKTYEESERILNLAEEYRKEYSSLIESTISDHFTFVDFKLFDVQVNGGIKEVCEVTVGGVPYDDVNSAGKINAGLDIIKTLSDYYQVKAPIFIDNAESVNKLLDMDNQMIRLEVSQDKELVIIND